MLRKKTKTQILQELTDYIHQQAPKETAENLGNFAKDFYNTIATDDLRQRSIEDLFGAIFSLWGFIRKNKANQSKVRVYNPAHEQHGWQSTHTVIEISHLDMPFLVDSICMEVNRMGMLVHISIHSGCYYFVRDQQGNITDILNKEQGIKQNIIPEAVLYLEVDRQQDSKICKKIQDNILRILRDVSVTVEDWQKICTVVEQNMDELSSCSTQLEQAEYDESTDFLRWLLNNHFTFLGSRSYSFVGKDGEEALELIQGTGLGVLRENADTNLIKSLTSFPTQIRQNMLSNQILLIAKTNTVSTVHRSAYTDYIGIKRFDRNGNAVGLTLIIGLYTSTAYNSNPSTIPFLRKKMTTILEKSKLSLNGHAGKALLNILQTLPRDDLFQANTEQLFELSMGILHLQERQRTKLFMLKDPYNRYYSCLVFVPRERFNTDLRRKMNQVLLDALNGIDSSFSTQFSDSILARVHFIIRIDPQDNSEFDSEEIEQQLIATARSWRDDLRENLIDYYGEAKGVEYFSKYRDAFTTSYCEQYSPRTVIYDINHIEKLTSEHVLEMSLQRTYDDYREKLQLKLFNFIASSPLSDVLPLLENMGLRVLGEQPSTLNFADGQTIWINDFQMIHSEDAEINIDEIRDNFQQAFTRIWFGEAEDDRFNRLILAAQLSWKETALLRAYARYIKQMDFRFSQDYLANTLYHHPKIAKEMALLFKAKFDPDYTGRSDKLLNRLTNKIYKDLDSVESLDEDRILRRFLDLILATIRTNYFVKAKDGGELPYISFKFASKCIPDMPLPVPMYEIFVYSPRTEGIHLRGAKVARGGLRWSDRREDYRTEVLGLMKAQQVKNAVIVPLGAKGGFITKALPTDGTREEVMQEVIHCYQTFIKGLLDVTDNIIDSQVIHPERVVFYDEPDPYLVVAADKGTATFSDLANAISEQYQFWLGDAFASGGSTGYDHKKMGITAKGAWESAKRNFREVLNIDTQNEEFSVIGVGDMAGDVFGNGMLLSKHIKLIAAFNHMHIFIDPDPDTATSFTERQRLFNLPRSSWEDYDRLYISAGGGVFKRSDKSIKLSKQIKKRLGISANEITPNELIKAILQAKVDMFWNGGIGTFVKAENETHLDAGDKSNDAIRVNAKQLGCKIVVEGGNLGLTQQARIEFALNGGRINTDFIDNSAGVDCSDHEVNIKILLNSIIANGDLTIKQRNKLLLDMTDEIAELVLANNYLQTETISLEQFSSFETMDLCQRYINYLEKTGKIDRALEGLPTDEQILERKALSKGLTRPEIAVLVSYDKTLLKEEILASDLPEDPYFTTMLQSAFPKLIVKKFAEEMKSHSLRREIIATQLSNCVTNAMGINFVHRLHRETGDPTTFIVRAYIATQELLGLNAVWQKIRALDCQIDTKDQFSMMLQLYFLARRSTRWFLRNYSSDFDISAIVKLFTKPFNELKHNIPEIITPEQLIIFDKHKQDLIKKGVPDSLADEMSRYLFLFNALDIMQGGKSTAFSNLDMAKMYFLISSRLELTWLRGRIIKQKTESQWDELARSVLLDDLDLQQKVLTLNVLKYRENDQSLEQAFDCWQNKFSDLTDRWTGLLTDIRASQNSGYVMYTVLLKEFHDLAKTGQELMV